MLTPLVTFRSAIEHDAESLCAFDDLMAALTARGGGMDEATSTLIDLSNRVRQSLPPRAREIARSNIELMRQHAAAGMSE